jgi:hypothetical protein
MEITRFQSMIQVLSRFEEQRRANPKLRLGFNTGPETNNPLYLFQPTKGAMKLDSLLIRLKLRKESKYEPLRTKNVSQILQILNDEIESSNIRPSQSDITTIQKVIFVLKNNLTKKSLPLDAFEREERRLNPHLLVRSLRRASLFPETSTDISNGSLSTSAPRAVESSPAKEESRGRSTPSVMSNRERPTHMHPDRTQSVKGFFRRSVANILMANDVAAKSGNTNSRRIRKKVDREILDCDAILAAGIGTGLVGTRSYSAKNETASPSKSRTYQSK